MERHALLLAGGGARAAYQVGCLRYIAGALPQYRPDILPGVSAGAINAVHLSSFRGTFVHAVERLRELWLELDTERVYHTELRYLLGHIFGAALPLFFPAVEPGNCWHGDGGVRLTAPLSPALHLGATRILAVSPRSRPFAQPKVSVTLGSYPSPAQVAGVMLNAVFLDMLDYDALQMSRINRLLHNLPPERRTGMRPVEVMVLRPSRDIGRLAAESEFRLPKAFRFFERGVSGGGSRNADALSMVNFEPEYLALLMELGEEDAARRGEEIESFLLGGACAVPVW